MKQPRVVFCLATMALAGAVPAAARAQAFGLNEIGSCATGRLVAVTGAPCNDASTIYWNPAAATTLRGVSVYLGAAAIAVNGGFQTDFTNRNYNADVPTSVPPHAFVNWKQSERLALGVGMYVPYGLTSQWKWDFPGRFSAQKAALASIYFQPNVAYEVVPGRLSIGGGPVVGYSTVQLKQGIDALSVASQLAAVGVVPGTEIGRAELKGSGTGFGAQVGLYAHVTPVFTVGLRYLTPIDFKYDDATAKFTQTMTGFRFPTSPTTIALLDTIVAHKFQPDSALAQQKGSTHIKHPGQLQFGLGFTGIPGTTISADVGFNQWSSFKELPINFSGGAPDRTIIEDYKNSMSVRGGIEHRFGIAGVGIDGRAGFGYTQTPAPDETVTPLLPDMNRYNYAFGIGLPLGPRYTIDASYLRVDTKGRRGRIVERSSRDQTAAELNSGFYSLDANIVSLSLKAQF